MHHRGNGKIKFKIRDPNAVSKLPGTREQWKRFAMGIVFLVGIGIFLVWSGGFGEVIGSLAFMVIVVYAFIRYVLKGR